jgi:hypothetical protein
VIAGVMIYERRLRGDWQSFAAVEGLSVGKSEDGFPLIKGMYRGREFSLEIITQPDL